MTIEEICEKYLIKKYTINPNGSIDADDNYIFITDTNLTELPLKFNKVSGNFSCSNNKLTSLKGAPSYVGGCFSCHSNNLTSLEYAPVYVGNHFYCDDFKLEDVLETDIKGDIYIKHELVSKQKILIAKLNKILKDFDLYITNEYIIKNCYDDIVLNSNEKNLEKDIMELINVY